MVISTHTPGPWAVEDPMGEDVGLWIVQGGLKAHEWSCIAIVPHDDEDTRTTEARFITPDEQKANARLIGAAPGLVKALEAAIRAAKLALFVINKQGVMPNSSWESGFKADLATAEAALSKAKGES